MSKKIEKKDVVLGSVLRVKDSSTIEKMVYKNPYVFKSGWNHNMYVYCGASFVVDDNVLECIHNDKSFGVPFDADGWCWNLGMFEIVEKSPEIMESDDITIKIERIVTLKEIKERIKNDEGWHTGKLKDVFGERKGMAYQNMLFEKIDSCKDVTQLEQLTVALYGLTINNYCQSRKMI